MLVFAIVSLILFAFGSIVGSFLNVVIYRSVIGEDWVAGRSRCDHCHKYINWYDNIPLLSYLVLQGKCRFCKKPIAISHPVIEFMTGSLFVWWYWGGSLFFQLTRAPFTTLQPIFWLSVGILLLMIFMTDILYLLIPDVAVSLLMMLTVIYRVSLTLVGIMETGDLMKAVMGMILSVSFFAALWYFTGGRGMGFGDVKLVAPLALLLGWPKIIVALFLAFVMGAAVGSVMIIAKKTTMKNVLPFGPFLIMGTVISLTFGDQLLHFYLSLL